MVKIRLAWFLSYSKCILSCSLNRLKPKVYTVSSFVRGLSCYHGVGLGINLGSREIPYPRATMPAIYAAYWFLQKKQIYE